VDESPEAIADLVLSSLTPQDRLLLQRQAELAAEAAQARAAPALSSGGSGSGSSGSGSVAHSSPKVQRMQQVVDHLIATASAELQRKAAAERQQHAAQLAQQQQREGEQHPGQQQQQQQRLGDLAASGTVVGRLVASGMGWAAGESALGSTAGAAGEPSGSGAKGGTAHTVTQLMGLFKASPLFRGGPGPGVQVLHRRWVWDHCWGVSAAVQGLFPGLH